MIHDPFSALKLGRRGLFVAIVAMTLPTTTTSAANRKGSRRVGGTNSAGKGSRYVGGTKSSK